MKKVLQVVIFLLIPFITFGQAGTQVDYEDGLGTETLSYAGIANGKESYSNPGVDLYLTWSGTRWEVTCCGGNVLYASDEPTAMNPPNFTVGNYYNVNNGGVPLIALSGTGTTSTVLPVELIWFNALMIEGGIQLKWQTASEINNEKFEVEESQDGREFQKIGEVEGKGTTLEQQDYSFEVKNPRNGISYYRLKQIDFDGQFEYSKVISVNFKGENGEVGQFYPNPSKSGIVNLEYISKTDEEITISVFDVTGKLIVNQIQQISNGDNNLSFDFSELNTGIYIFKIGDERNPTHRKLIIER